MTIVPALYTYFINVKWKKRDVEIQLSELADIMKGLAMLHFG